MEKFSDYQLILCSSFADIKDRLLLKKIISTGSYQVGIIKNAADYDKEQDQYPQRITDDEEALVSLGCKIIEIDLTKVSEGELRYQLSNLDIIHVCGGNTFWLLECMIKSGFKKLIKDYLDNGIIYIGTSAGSCICSPNIEYVKYADNPTVSGNTDYEGLNLINVYINPHFNGDELPDSDVQQAQYVYQNPHYPLFSISDDQALCVDMNQKITIIN